MDRNEDLQKFRNRSVIISIKPLVINNVLVKVNFKQSNIIFFCLGVLVPLHFDFGTSYISTLIY